MQKGEIFVTGGVFLLDIGLLMGAIGSNISTSYTTLRRYDNFEGRGITPAAISEQPTPHKIHSTPPNQIYTHYKIS